MCIIQRNSQWIYYIGNKKCHTVNCDIAVSVTNILVISVLLVVCQAIFNI